MWGAYPTHYLTTVKQSFYDPANIAVVDVDGVRAMELRAVSGRTNGKGKASRARSTPARAEERRLHSGRAQPVRSRVRAKVSLSLKKALGKQFGKQDLRYQHVTWIGDGGEPPR